MTPFTPFHINATPEDLAGNGDIGRYIFFPGSDGRAKLIAEHFENLTVKSHPRGHHLYLGNLKNDGKKIAVAAISSGMGCPSMEIILHELFHLGAKRFLRIGTAGTLQPEWLPIGDFVNVQASVRDEDTTQRYAPVEVPAVASLEFISAILLASEKLGLSDNVHTGIVHCKSALYAREFSNGPKASENTNYMSLLQNLGVLASEMETAALFIQSQFYNHSLMQESHSAQQRVLAGAILGIIATAHGPLKMQDHTTLVEQQIQLGLETIKTLAAQELLS